MLIILSKDELNEGFRMSNIKESHLECFNVDVHAVFEGTAYAVLLSV